MSRPEYWRRSHVCCVASTVQLPVLGPLGQNNTFSWCSGQPFSTTNHKGPWNVRTNMWYKFSSFKILLFQHPLRLACIPLPHWNVIHSLMPFHGCPQVYATASFRWSTLDFGWNFTIRFETNVGFFSSKCWTSHVQHKTQCPPSVPWEDHVDLDYSCEQQWLIWTFFPATACNTTYT